MSEVFTPTVSCPACAEVVKAVIERSYTNFLGVPRVLLCCPKCDCKWAEFRDDIMPAPGKLC